VWVETLFSGNAAMNTTYSTTGLAQTTASTRRVSSAFKNFWNAFQEWRKWERLRAEFCNLNERELMDIGITRGEIDYVASNRSIDPPGPIHPSDGTPNRFNQSIEGHRSTRANPDRDQAV
jgi:uncharacterized protein YjiS (DUF1127 family)